MQKVHGPAIETPAEARQAYLDHPARGALMVSLSLLVILYAVIYFGFSAT
jgi:hypothetical protein